jgi:hypothetical protein
VKVDEIKNVWKSISRCMYLGCVIAVDGAMFFTVA